MSKFVKILPAPAPKDKSDEETSSNEMDDSQNVIPPKKSKEDVNLEKNLDKSKEENKSIKSLLESDPLENAGKEEGQIKAVSIKKEIVEDKSESEKLEKGSELLNEDSVVTPEPVLTPISESISGELNNNKVTLKSF